MTTSVKMAGLSEQHTPTAPTKRDLIDFLATHHTPSDPRTTIVSLESGKWCLTYTRHEEFLKLYTRFIVGAISPENHRKRATESLGVCFGEMPIEPVPLTVDIDLSTEYIEAFEHEGLPQLYTLTDVESTINSYIEHVRSLLAIPEYPDMWKVLLLEKPAYITDDGKKVKNGFHLHFPNITLSFIDCAYIHNTVTCELPVDTDIAKNVWLMYGSSKSTHHTPYLVTRMYKEYPTVEAYELPPSLEELPRLLSVRRSVQAHVRIKQLNTPATFNFSFGGGVTVRPIARASSSTAEPADIDQVRLLASHLADSRATVYSKWVNIGWILFNVTNGSADGFEIFKEFSQRGGASYNYDSCKRLWETAQVRNITIRSLLFYARQDSDLELSLSALTLDDTGRQRPINISEMFTHHELAQLVFEKYKTEFVCASISQKLWYHYRSGLWVQNDDGVELRNLMGKYILHLLNEERENVSQEVTDEIRNIDPNDDIQLALAKANKAKAAKHYAKCHTLINTNTFKQSIQREATDLFYNDAFLFLLDTNPKLIAFRNGVYDCESDTFRTASPEDFLSKCMPFDYDESLTDDSPSVQAVHRLLEQLFPNKRVRQYFLDQYSYIFEGGNMYKNIIFWIGRGNNGKSVLETLFEKMLGPYAIKLPTSLITGKRGSSSSASPDLVRVSGGVRLVVMQEPDKSEEINAGILKELTGNDTFYARGLYKDGSEIIPMFKTVMVANDAPRVPEGDQAVWARIKVLPFQASFVDDAPADYNEQLRTRTFQKDRHFTQKLDALVTAFAYVLLRHREQRRANNIDVIEEPEEVTIVTAEYQRRNNAYAQYVNEFIGDKEGARLRVMVVYLSFKEWYKQCIGSNVPSKSDAERAFSKIIGEPVSTANGTLWENKIIRSTDDGEEEDGDD